MNAVLIATWTDGIVVLNNTTRSHELAQHSIQALVADAQGGALAIVDNHLLRRRSPGGAWQTLAESKDLSCCVAVGSTIYAGTDDARVLRINAGGSIEPLGGFDTVEGRETWYAGRALINGELMGPPLGIRSISATADGKTLLANVHVGGIPRSIDGGETWQPTIEIDTDVHEVRGHPQRPNVVAAAAAAGLCISMDGGAGWSIDQNGLHAVYCSSVNFAGDDVLVSASDGHFASESAIYRRAIDRRGGLHAIEGPGLPGRIAGIADTCCIATQGATIAIADRGGHVYVSEDAGRRWKRVAEGIPTPSAALIIRNP